MLMARKLAQRGWRVFAGVLPGADTRELTEGAQLTVIPQDVTDAAMVRAGAGQVAAALNGQGLDLLINNAGVANIATGVLEAVDMNEARRLFDINVFGMINVIQAHLPMLHDSRQAPRIINFASGAVRVPLPCSAIYNMSKYAVEGMTNTLRYELAPFGIQVTSIEPGAVATGMTANPVEGTARIWERTPPEIRRRYEAKIRPITDDLGRRLLDSNDPGVITDEVLELVDVARLKPRYMVGKEVKMLPLMQRLLSEAAFERLIARQFHIQ
jgi:NAD(P)-dependent dehydrogenase (short-subunit alcohol dehydrogenase family)